jgi:RNA polymerase sigma factor (sigma-70 family)
MTTGLSEVIGRVRVGLTGDVWDLLPDKELLARFAGDRDEAAFAELVRRHGPTVLAECRRVLFDRSACDDAFQATFLVLSQKAGTIRDADRLGGWLRGVARKVARRARKRAARRAEVEQPLSESGEAAFETPPQSTDLCGVLAEELGRLPRHYRDAVIVCDVDGLSRRAAARRLSIPVGTLSNRLTAARELLARRLLRRGVALGLALSVSSATRAIVSNRLFAATLIAVRSGIVPPVLQPLLAEGPPSMVLVRSTLAATVVGSLFCLAVALAPKSAVVHAAPPPVPVVEPADPRPPKPAPGRYTYSARFSRDGRYLALSMPKTFDGKGEHEVILYDTRTWKERFRLTGPTQNSFGLEFSSDGKTLFAASHDGTIHSWDTVTGKPGRPLTAKDERCIGITASPDGKVLASTHVNWDEKPRPSYVRIWDASTGEMRRKIEFEQTTLTESVTFTPDGKAIAVGLNALSDDAKKFNGVLEYDVATGKELRRYDAIRITAGARPVTHSIAYTPDGKWMIVGGGEAIPDQRRTGCSMHGYLWVFDRATGKLEKTLLEDRSDYVRVVRLSEDGRRLYVTTNSPLREVEYQGQRASAHLSQIPCWDTTDWTIKWTYEEKQYPCSLTTITPSPDGRRLVVVNDRGVFLHDTKTGEEWGGLVAVEK